MTKAAPPIATIPSIARGQATLAVSAVTGMAVSFALTLVAARHLDAWSFGQFALVGTFLALARDLSDLGSGAVAVRAAAQDPVREKDALEALLQWRFVTTVLLAVACLAFAAVRREAMLVATAAVIVATTYNALVAVFQLRGRLDRAAWINIAAQSLALGLAIVLSYGAAAGWAFAAVLLVRELTIVLAGRYAALRLLPFVPRLRVRALARRAQWQAITHYAGAALLFHVLLNAGTFLGAVTVSATSFAAYAGAVRLMTPAFSLPWILTAPLVPMLSDMAATDRAAFARQASALLLLAGGGAGILAVAGAIRAPDILALLFDGRFAGAVPTLRWLMLAFVGVTILAARAPLMLAAGRERQLLHRAALATGLTIVAQAGCIATGHPQALGMVMGVVLLGTAVAPDADSGGMWSGSVPVAAALIAVVALLVAIVPDAAPVMRIAGAAGVAFPALVLLYRLPPIAMARAGQAAWLRTGAGR